MCQTAEITPAPYESLYRLRTPAAEERLRLAGNPCEICGKELDKDAPVRFYAVTTQGEFPLGSTCLAKARKAGIPIMEWRN